MIYLPLELAAKSHYRSKLHDRSNHAKIFCYNNLFCGTPSYQELPNWIQMDSTIDVDWSNMERATSIHTFAAETAKYNQQPSIKAKH